MHRKNWQIVLFSLVMSSLWSLSVSAQSSFGTITGTVVDSTGSVIPGATVVATNLGTNDKHTVQTGAAGGYRFVDLVPANYKVEVDAASFKRYVQGSVAVEVDNTVRVDAALQIGAATETVEVTTAVPQLQTESGSVGTEIEGKVVDEMPLNGRNPMNLIALAPGVVPGSGALAGVAMSQGIHTSQGNWDGYTIGGGAQGQSAQYLDGAPDNELGANLQIIVPTQDAVQEFRLSMNSVSPEFGRFSGGVAEFSTKSGSNAFHGSLYEYFRNTVLNANYFLADNAGLPKVKFNQNQYGVLVSGPIKRDKAFFMFNYEKFTQRTDTTGATNVFTQNERNGIFTGQLKDPGGICAAKAGNANTGFLPYNAVTNTTTIPKACFDPTSVIEFQYTPLPNSTANPAYNYNASPEVGNDTSNYTARVDYNLSTKQRIFARYMYQIVKDIPENEFAGLGLPFPTSYAPNFLWTHAAVLGDTYTIDPNTVADLRLSYSRETFINNAPGTRNTNMAAFGPAYAAFAPYLSFTALPDLVFSGSHSMYNFAPVGGSVQDKYDNYAINASVTKIIGAHTIKFGVEGRLLQHNGLGNLNSMGTNSNYNTSLVGDEVAAFVLGEFATDAVSTVIPTTTYNYPWGAYVADTWKASQNLTLNLGVRWELPGGMEEKKGRATVLLPNEVDPSTGYLGAVALVNTALYPHSSVEPFHYKFFSPRVGFAERLGGSTVLRGGLGLEFLPPDGPAGVMAYNSPVAVGTNTSINIAGTVPTFFNANPFCATGTICNPATQIIQAYGRSNPLFSSTLLNQAVAGVVPSSHYPYQMQWNLTLGHQWKGDWMTEASYVGNKGTRLAETYGYNQIPDQDYTASVTSPTGTVISQNGIATVGPNAGTSITTTKSCAALGGASVTVGRCLQPYPQFTNFTDSANYSGSSTYNALFVTVSKRFRTGGLLNANYAWSKWMDDTGAQDYYNKAANRSLDGSDIRGSFTLNYVLDLPFGPGRRFANGSGPVSYVIGGWTVNGITRVRSGNPIAITLSGGSLGSFGTGGLRPNYVPGCQRTTSGSTLQKFLNQNWFNAACFVSPGNFAFGNEPRVDPVLRGETVDNTDFALVKATKIRESLNAQFRIETFNLFNHPVFSNPASQMNGSFYDGINQNTNNNPPPRLIQASLRLNY